MSILTVLLSYSSIVGQVEHFIRLSTRGVMHHEPDRARKFVESQRERAEALVVRYRSEIAAVAAALVEKLEMSGDQIRAIVHIGHAR
jgi:hypothetical protein